MSRANFDKELELLNEDLIRMGAATNDAIEKSITSLETADHILAKAVIKGDKNIDDMERTIESRCLRLILHQQPVAKDLRIISTAIKMITDMERIADQAADIADIVLRSEDISKISSFIPQMAKITIEMVSDSISSFINSDLELANSIIDRDDDVDDLFNAVKNEVVKLLRSGASEDEIVDILMIAKYLERIGDHAVNICEWVEFCETGVHKHTQIL